MDRIHEDRDEEEEECGHEAGPKPGTPLSKLWGGGDRREFEKQVHKCLINLEAVYPGWDPAVIRELLLEAVEWEIDSFGA